ncbi:MAG: PEGA domain-containing protein [Spirochaetales bacterium]|nr:PEGA domain-containing protein [Spirochaetales bacterium]
MLKRNFCFSFVILLLTCISLGAQDIVSAQETYTIIITQLKGNNLSAENQALLNSIPLLLKESISAITTHHLDPEEISALREEAVNTKLIQVYENLRDKKKDRDQLPYSQSSSSQKSEYQKQIEGYLDEIREIKAYPLENIQVKEILPVSLLRPQKKGELFAPPEFSPLTYTKENNGDLLLTGSIEEIFGYFYLQIRLYDRLKAKLILDYNNSGEASDIIEELSELKAQVIPLVLGREYGRLSILPSDPKAFVFLNGSFAGIGKTEIPFIEPGDYSIEVAQKGFETKKLAVTLKKGDEIELAVDLTALDFGQVALNSEPSEAMVYENSQYIGMTPLVINKLDTANQILLKKEGYQDKSLTVDKNSSDQLNIPLLLEGESLSELQQKKRNDFYFAFGFFLLSLPVSFFLDVYSKDYYDYYRSNFFYLSEGDQETFFNTSNGFRISQWAAWAVSGGLAANMLWQLYLYIDSTNKLVD